MSARLIQVIETDLELRGDGTPNAPYRRVTQYWSTDGRLLAEVDPCEPTRERPAECPTPTPPEGA